MNIQLNLSFFESIYNDTYDNTLKYIICKCSNPDDANDIIQDVYLELYKILQKDDGLMVNSAKAFILGIAKNKVRQYWSLKYKLQSAIAFSRDDDEIINDVTSKESTLDIVLVNDDIDKIKEFIKKKKPIPRKIFYLYYFYEMSLKEIAEELDMNLSTVKSNLYRLIDDLNEYFKEE